MKFAACHQGNKVEFMVSEMKSGVDIPGTCWFIFPCAAVTAYPVSCGALAVDNACSYETANMKRAKMFYTVFWFPHRHEHVRTEAFVQLWGYKIYNHVGPDLVHLCCDYTKCEEELQTFRYCTIRKSFLFANQCSFFSVLLPGPFQPQTVRQHGLLYWLGLSIKKNDVQGSSAANSLSNLLIILSAWSERVDVVERIEEWWRDFFALPSEKSVISGGT